MDPLSVIASVIAVGTLAVQSSTALLDLISTIRDAPEQIISISEDTAAFQSIVSSLHVLLKDKVLQNVLQKDAALLLAIANLRRPLDNCMRTLTQLKSKLQAHFKPSSDGNGSRLSSFDVKWYFRKKKDVADIMSQLLQNKRTLASGLNNIALIVDLRRIKSYSKAPESSSSDNMSMRWQDSNGTDSEFALRRYLNETSISPVIYQDGGSQIVQEPISLQGDPGPLQANSVHPKQATSLIMDSKQAKPGTQTPKYELDALHVAAKYDEVTKNILFISQGIGINAINADGKSALHLAAEYGSIAAAQALLKAGANMECKDITEASDEHRQFCGGRAPIHWAAGNGHEAVVKLLLDHGAKVAPMDITWRIPLQEAIMHGHRSIVRLLLARGSSLDTQDINGWTPMHEVVSRSGGDGPMTRYLLFQQPNLEIASVAHHGGLTPLLLATRLCHIDIVKMLLDAGASPAARSTCGETALHIASWHGTMGIMTTDLLDKGADIEARDPKAQETPLHKAALRGKDIIIRILLERGADIHAVNSLGQDALMCAQIARHKAAEKLLTERINQTNTSK